MTKHFQIDNDFLDGYAKEIGYLGTTVYMALKRHSNKKNEAFPSQRHLAIELGLSRTSVKGGIKALELWNILLVKRRGKTQSNLYLLLDRKMWKPAIRWSNKKE